MSARFQNLNRAQKRHVCRRLTRRLTRTRCGLQAAGSGGTARPRTALLNVDGTTVYRALSVRSVWWVGTVKWHCPYRVSLEPAI
jgi:hypothetical protein